MTHELPPLPFAQDALAPHMSAETFALHHGKHHAGYVGALNDLIAGTPYADMDVLEIVHASAKKPADRKIFNNAAQHWNHSFFWNAMRPGGGGAPGGPLGRLIDRDFGGWSAFRERFIAEGASHFASGWVWLVRDGGALAVVSTHDADLPQLRGAEPLLVCDLWEHAYYVDYRNDRRTFLTVFLDALANWEWAERQLERLDPARAAQGGAHPAP